MDQRRAWTESRWRRLTSDHGGLAHRLLRRNWIEVTMKVADSVTGSRAIDVRCSVRGIAPRRFKSIGQLLGLDPEVSPPPHGRRVYTLRRDSPVLCLNGLLVTRDEDLCLRSPVSLLGSRAGCHLRGGRVNSHLSGGWVEMAFRVGFLGWVGQR